MIVNRMEPFIQQVVDDRALMSEAKRAKLRPWLVKAYLAAEAPREFRLVCTLWLALGFEHPLYGFAG